MMPAKSWFSPINLIFAAILLIAGIAAAWGLKSPASPLVNPQVDIGPLQAYAFKDGSARLSVPDNWRVVELRSFDYANPYAVARIYPNGLNLPMVTIARRDLQETFDNETPLKWARMLADIRHENQLLSQEQVSPAHWLIDYSFQDQASVVNENKVEWRCRDQAMAQTGAVYVITACARAADWARLEPGFTAILNSFMVTGQPPVPLTRPAEEVFDQYPYGRIIGKIVLLVILITLGILLYLGMRFSFRRLRAGSKHLLDVVFVLLCAVLLVRTVVAGLSMLV